MKKDLIKTEKTKEKILEIENNKLKKNDKINK